MADPRLDVARVVATLARHRVRYVLIGGLAGAAWGSTIVTQDLDICYARDREDLSALAAALRELHARLRGAERDVPFKLDAESLRRGDHFTFTTDAGALDCIGTPAGVAGYEELRANAVALELHGESVLVAALDDLIRMKRAAGRPRDLAAIPVLIALRDEVAKRARRKRDP